MSKLHQVFGIVHVDLPVAVARSSLGGVAVRYIPVLPVLRMTSCWSIIGHDVGDVSAASTHNDSSVSGTGPELSMGPFCVTQPNPLHFITPSDQFPVPVRSAIKSNLTAWCNQILSNRALNALNPAKPTKN